MPTTAINQPDNLLSTTSHVQPMQPLQRPESAIAEPTVSQACHGQPQQ